MSTATTTRFFAVGDFGGPVSVEINAESAAAAAEWFNDQTTSFEDAGRTDAENALDFCGDGMTSEEFAAELQARGYTVASSDLCDDGNWVLWVKRSTRTIIAVTDAHCWSLENVPAERIVELMYEAGEAYYANRDDVGSFEVIERLERYSNVDLPADYNKAESKAIMTAAWELYCNGPAQG